MDTLQQRVLEIVDAIIYINVATCNEHKEPWNTPTYAVHDSQLNFFWRSWVHSQHSANIRTNPGVFISVYDSTRKLGQNIQRGVYIKATAVEINDNEEIAKVITYFTDKIHTVEEFSGSSVKRLYKAIPEKIWLNELSESQVTNDTRNMRTDVPLFKAI